MIIIRGIIVSPAGGFEAIARIIFNGLAYRESIFFEALAKTTINEKIKS